MRIHFGATVAVLLLCACDDRVVAPRTFELSAELAARAGADASLSTYVVSLSQIGMQWTDIARNESGWEIQRSTNGASGTFSLRGTTGADVTAYSDTALAQGTEYCYEVRSFRITGTKRSYDAFSSASCSTTPTLPAPPTAVRALAGWSYVDVSWINSVSQTDSTRLERSTQVAGPWQRVASFTSSYLPNAISYRDEGLPPERLDCYRLVAFNRWGASSSSNTPCTSPIAPPSDLVAISRDGHTVTLSWRDNSAYEDGYVVSRSGDASSWTVVADLPPNTTSYNDASVALDTRYAYRLQGRKDGSVTAQAGPVWIAVASGPPLAPSDVAAVPSGSTAVWVGWASSVTATSYRVERSTDGQSTWQSAGVTMEASFFDPQRVAERQVCYRVYAVNSLGQSAPSPVDCTIPPLAPTNVGVMPQADGSQLVSWSDNSNVEDAYSILVSYDPCFKDFECYFYCYPDGCYYVTCDANGCYRPAMQEKWYDAAANATNQGIDGTETLVAVYAMRDGGYSDPGTIAFASAALGTTSSRSTRGSPAIPFRSSSRKLRTLCAESSALCATRPPRTRSSARR